ncbi:MAG: hypothetical protein K2Z81_05415 [Cyanobacteria bacterium]|nr:hypothetical protein [Cyanobacteriota bacterium]
MTHTVICTIPTESEVCSIVDLLKDSGIRNSVISIMIPDQSREHNLVHEKPSKDVPLGKEGDTLLSGTLGWLAGIRRLTLPGIGPCVVAGPLIAALGGEALGTTAGVLINGLVDLGIPAVEAKGYAEKLGGGSILLSVQTGKDYENTRVVEILKTGGAKDINRTSEESVKSPA